MANKDFELHVGEISNRFDYAFASLGFAALALSFQFSPGMGTKWPYALIASWVLLLLSGFAGGWRLMKESTFYKYNLQVSKLQKRINERKRNLANPQYVAALKAGHLVDGLTGEQLDENEQRQILKDLEEGYEFNKMKMLEVSSRLPKFFKFQFSTFVLGILMNGIFNSVNFLAKV